MFLKYEQSPLLMGFGSTELSVIKFHELFEFIEVFFTLIWDLGINEKVRYLVC